MADISELGLVTNCCGGMSFVYESRAYKFKFTGKQRKCCGCSKRRAEETKPIPVIYDEEASSAATVTSGYFPVFKRVQFMRTAKAGKNLLLWHSALKHIVVFATDNNIGLLGQTKIWGMDSTF
ncbi:hypothetical protein T06_322 [Trichinella sp. T6]|nr:hypothetical protein T06_322 [Trichinella sp. T6]